MKKMKKFLAMLLAMTMIMGLSLTAFAAQEEEPTTPLTPATVTAPQGKIVVQGVPEGATVNWKQIVEPDASTAAADWKLTSDAGLSDNDFTTLKAQTPLNNSNAETGTISATIGGIIEKVAMPDPAASSEQRGNLVVINAQSAGLYVIEVVKEGWTFSRMMAYVGYDYDATTGAATVGGAVVTAKGETNDVNKVLGITGTSTAEEITSYQSATEGDIIPFTVTLKYPSLNPNENGSYPAFTIVDNVAGGTIVQDATHSVTLTAVNKVTNTTVDMLTGNPAKATLKVDQNKDQDKNTASMTLTFNYDPQFARGDVTLTYYIEVGTASNLTNTVTSNVNGTSTSDRVIVDKADVDITKVDATNADVKLAGAKFKLYVVVSDLKDATDILTLAAGKTDEGTIAAKSGDETEGIFLNEVDESELTPENGKITFTDLDADKTYWVVESQAPTGYSLNTTAVKLVNPTVTESVTEELLNPNAEESVNNPMIKVTKYTVNGNFNATTGGVSISDTQLSSLPSTGGIGTTIFTIGGCAIMIIAAGLYFSLRRKSAK